MKRQTSFFSGSFFLFSLICSPMIASSAEILTLQNGDKIKVEVMSEDLQSIIVKHAVLGEMKVLKTQIASLAAESKAEPQRGDLKTKGEISAGYSLTQGNTDTSQLQGDFLYNRNRLWIDEWTLKGSALKSYADDESTAQRYDVSLRYGYSLTKELFSFARVSAEHDFFQDIKIRVVPTAGLGYWILDTDKTKFLLETGTGYQYEMFRSGGSEGAWILHGRAMASRQITEKLKVQGDVYFFPEVLDFGNYRIEADAGLEYELSSRWALKVELQDRYRSRPADDAKNNDLRLISGLKFKL